MANFRESLLPMIDAVRNVPGDLGLRQHTVTVRVRAWTSSRPGVDASTYTDTDTVITVGTNGEGPKVRNVTQKDVIASGGLYSAEDYKVGPISPAYPGGGTSEATLDPSVSGVREIYWKIEGPGMGSSGTWFKKIGGHTDDNFHYTVVLSRTGVPTL